MRKKSFLYYKITLRGVIIINICLKINSALLWDNVLEIRAIGQGMWGNHSFDCERWTFAERKSFNFRENLEQRRHSNLESVIQADAETKHQALALTTGITILTQRRKNKRVISEKVRKWCGRESFSLCSLKI